MTILNHVLFGEFTHEMTDVYVIHHVSYLIRKTPHSSMICSLRVWKIFYRVLLMYGREAVSLWCTCDKMLIRTKHKKQKHTGRQHVVVYRMNFRRSCLGLLLTQKDKLCFSQWKTSSEKMRQILTEQALWLPERIKVDVQSFKCLQFTL